MLRTDCPCELSQIVVPTLSSPHIQRRRVFLLNASLQVLYFSRRPSRNIDHIVSNQIAIIHLPQLLPVTAALAVYYQTTLTV